MRGLAAMTPAWLAQVPRVALTPDEAAAAVGVSRDYFDEHILPGVRHVHIGRRRVIPVAALAKWLEAQSVLDAPS